MVEVGSTQARDETASFARQAQAKTRPVSLDQFRACVHLLHRVFWAGESSERLKMGCHYRSHKSWQFGLTVRSMAVI